MAPAENPWYVFAGGGTGGHLYPSLAIIRALRSIALDADVSFYCTRRPIDRGVLDHAGVNAVPQFVRPFAMKPWRWPMFLFAWRRAILTCIRHFRQRRPAVVLGAGGYGSDPAVRAAIAMGIPTAILNPDLVPGRANQRLGPRVDRVFAQWDKTKAYYRNGANVVALGCPIRPDFGHADRTAGMRRFELDPTRKVLLVTGASQGARSINEAMLRLAGDLQQQSDWQILHLAGRTDVERVTLGYRTAGVTARVIAFTEHMAEAMATAELVISRAGASTLAEITAVGLPSILLPYPYDRKQHQRHNADVLAEAGAAVVVCDAVDPPQTAAALGPALFELLAAPSRVQAMRQAALSLGKPNAARDIARELVTLATR